MGYRHGISANSIEQSEILQQPLDVIELELRPRRIGKTLAQFLEDAARALHVDLARDFHRNVVAIIAPAQRPAERVGIVVGARLPLPARTTPARPLSLVLAA